MVLDIYDDLDKESGRFETNLAEFPLIFLTKGSVPLEKYTYRDEIRFNGKWIERVWTIHPSAKCCWGNTMSVQVLYEVMQLWKVQGYKRNIKYGSIYHLCKRMNLSMNRQYYDIVKTSLDFLSGMKIDCENAFYDPVKGGYESPQQKSILDGYTEWTSKPKRGRANKQDVLPFGEIEVGYFLEQAIPKDNLFSTSFNSAFFHSLSPLEQRLCLYLSKIFKFYPHWYREIDEFATQIPLLSKSYTRQRQLIIGATKSLMKKKFKILKAMKYQPGKVRKKSYGIETNA